MKLIRLAAATAMVVAVAAPAFAGDTLVYPGNGAHTYQQVPAEMSRHDSAGRRVHYGVSSDGGNATGGPGSGYTDRN